MNLSRRRFLGSAAAIGLLATTVCPINAALAAATYVVTTVFPTDGTQCDDALDSAIAAAVAAVAANQALLSSNQYFRGGVVIQLPAGAYLFKRGHIINCAHILVVGAGGSNTILLKSGDFGNLLQIIDPQGSQNTGNCGFIGIGAIDIGPTSGGALFGLKYCGKSVVEDVVAHNGFIGLLLDGVTDTFVRKVRCTSDIYFGQTPAQVAAGTPGAYKAGSAMIALVQTGSNANSNLEMSNIVAAGYDPSNRFTAAGILISSADVVLIHDAEIGAVADADMHVAATGNLGIQGLQTTSIEFDNGSPYGLLVDGTTTAAVGDWSIDGRFFGHDISNIKLNCPNLASAKFGVLSLGAGGTPISVLQGTDLQFDNPILRGFGGSATGPHQFSGIDIQTSNTKVIGGIIRDYQQPIHDLAYGVRLSDGSTGCMVTGLTGEPGPSAYGLVRCIDLNRNYVGGNLVLGGPPLIGQT